jgi:5-methylcytosine-specific restriction endonuclease McrA
VVTRRSLPANVQRQVRERASYLCEYCHTAEQWQYVRFTIDHIVALAQGGGDDSENLALACFHCNRKKSNLRTAIDPDTDEFTPLFHPRQHNWSDHFIWSTDRLRIVGLTPIGRATIAVLQLNRPRVLDIRAADRAVGRHPPPNDPVMQPEF